MSAATGFKRLGIAVAVIMLASLAALGAMSLLIPVDTVRQATQSQIRDVTGFELALRGDVAVSLFPTGSVRFSDVTLGDAAKPVIEAEQVTARLRLLPLLAGRVEIADVTLEHPRIDVTVDKDGNSNWAGLVDSLARAVGPNGNRGSDAGSFTEIRINDGTIVLNDLMHGLSETLSGAELALAWPSISKSFAATGHITWHDQLIEATVTLADFAAALAGDRTGVKARFTAAPLKFAFEGSASTQPTLKIEGTLAADSPSLRETFRWASLKPLSGGGFGRFALKAKTSIAGGTIALSAVNVELDGNVAEGVLTFASDGRQTLQGTLAAEDLNLTPYISTIRLLTANERDWNRMPLAVDGLSGFDLDLRLSAARITLAHARLGRTAIATNLRGGKLNVTIGESQAFGGVLKGNVALGAFESGAEFKSQLQFTDVDLEKCLGDIFQFRRLEGRGDIAMTLDASGSSVLALTRTLNGTANLTGRQGALVGINIEQLLRRLERRPLSGTGDFRNGRTPYEKLNVTLKINEGTATFEELNMEGAKVRLGLSGSASIPGREFDLRGVAALAAAPSSDGTPPFELPFMVQGPWDDPIMLPDTQALILRSPAAGPLLNAVKNRTTRDTVRSAIERLTGGAISPPAGAPAANR